MGTGGTIPTSRTQSVTFYHTAGIIERDKKLYFAPRFSTINAVVGQTVASAYLSAFRVTCPPSSVYSDITISSWSPEDRTLVVQGNIDDFRLVTDEGECLNYFIVTRLVSSNQSTKVFYYAFFITEVEQVGGSSVRITCEPDDFTNVFYLHNMRHLTASDISGDYDPFNEKMVNCYVDRQHYNRVKVLNETKHVLNVIIHTTTFFDIADNYDKIELTFMDSLYGTSVSGTILQHRWDSEENPTQLEMSIGYFDSIVLIGQEESTSDGVYNEELSFTFTYNNDDISWTPNVRQLLEPDNIKIFLNQPDSFKFKYQFRDFKYPLCTYGKEVTFTKTEMERIENASSFLNLYNEHRNLAYKVLESCLVFVAIEFKSKEVLGAIYHKQNNNECILYFKSGGKEGNLYRPNPVVYCPAISIPKIFEKFEDLNKVVFYSYIKYYEDTTFLHDFDYRLETVKELCESVLSNSVYGEYINSAYLTHYIPNLEIGVYVQSGANTTVSFTYNCILPIGASGKHDIDLTKGFIPVGLLSKSLIGYDYDSKNVSQIVNDHAFSIAYEHPEGFVSGTPIGFILGNSKPPLKTITIEEEERNSYFYKSNYYDPVLESEPYAFYTVSYLSANEIVFNKNRYYTGRVSEIKFTIYQQVNMGLKIGIVPTYTVEGKEIQYFNEGFSTIVAGSIPIVSDSYQDYYYQNMSQMKNQFAVNDFNRRTDLFQHFYLSGPNAVAQAGAKRGGAGAGMEALNQFVQMANEAIDWAQSNKIIEMNQKAVLADMGRKPDSLKNAGSDVYYDLTTKENNFFLNHYRIDTLSYQSIAKFLERFGYQVGLYSSLNVMDRVGWNYVKLISFDWHPDVDIMNSQEDSIKEIFLGGVTLLHNKTYLTSGHNFETILE